MTRIDPNAFAQNYLAGAQLGTQQFRIVDEMQQRQLAQQREQEQLQRTRMILKSVLQQSAAPALTGVPEQGMGPVPDSGGFAGAIEQNNKDVEELSAMIDVAGPESLRYISGLVDDRRKVSKALADARHAWDRGIAGHIDPKRHQDFAAFAQLFAAEQDPERKMARLDQFYQQQQAQTKAAEEKVKRESEITSLMRTQKWTRQQAEDFVTQQSGGLRNQLRGVTGDDRRDLSESAIQGSTEYKRAKLALDRVQRYIDEIETSMADPSLNPSGRKLLTQMLNAAREQERQAEDAIIEIYARQRGETGGQAAPAPMAQPTQPPTQTAAPVVDDATVAQVIKALTAKLGREPTDDEIDAAMEGV